MRRYIRWHRAWFHTQKKATRKNTGATGLQSIRCPGFFVFFSFSEGPLDRCRRALFFYLFFFVCFSCMGKNVLFPSSLLSIPHPFPPSFPLRLMGTIVVSSCMFHGFHFVFVFSSEASSLRYIAMGSHWHFFRVFQTKLKPERASLLDTEHSDERRATLPRARDRCYKTSGFSVIESFGVRATVMWDVSVK